MENKKIVGNIVVDKIRISLMYISHTKEKMISLLNLFEKDSLIKLQYNVPTRI